MADENEKEETAKDRKFRTLFDGDEVDGKFYPRNGGLTGIDHFTAEFLVKTGRLEEVDDETFDTLEPPYGEGESAETRAKAARKAADAKRIAAKKDEDAKAPEPKAGAGK